MPSPIRCPQCDRFLPTDAVGRLSASPKLQQIFRSQQIHPSTDEYRFDRQIFPPSGARNGSGTQSASAHVGEGHILAKEHALPAKRWILLNARQPQCRLCSVRQAFRASFPRALHRRCRLGGMRLPLIYGTTDHTNYKLLTVGCGAA